jgi:hypothetical protein
MDSDHLLVEHHLFRMFEKNILFNVGTMHKTTRQSEVKFLVPLGVLPGIYPLALINKAGTASADFETTEPETPDEE